jgi:hypothetical protein
MKTWTGALIVLTVAAPADAKGKSDCALMQRLAQEHSNDMARRESMDHDGFYGRATRGARAENVAVGSKTKGETMAQWQASPGHAANMRLPGCKAVAYAVSKSGQYYWTMEIGKSLTEFSGKNAGEPRNGFRTGDLPAGTRIRSGAQQVLSGIAGGIGKLRSLFQPTN